MILLPLFFLPVVERLKAVFNAICVLIFAQIVHSQQQESHMFRYLLVKSILDMVLFLLLVVDFLYLCGSACTTSYSIVMVIWYIAIYNYIVPVVQLTSVFLEVAATFDCYIMINNKLKYCISIWWFYLVCTSTSLFSGLSNVFRLIERYIWLLEFDDHL